MVAGFRGLFVALARYLPDGTHDDTFGVDGKALTNVVGRAFAVARQPDDKIVIAGDVPCGAFGFFRRSYTSPS